MTTSDDISAIKLPFEVGEYLATWQVPDRAGGTVDIPGLLTLEPNHYPRGTLYGSMPLEWIAPGVASFPQRFSFDTLVGRLSTGSHVALMNGQLEYWFDTQGRATGAFAVLSQEAFDSSEQRKYSSIELQIEALEAVAGVPPISHVKMPMKKDDEPVWAATINKDAKSEWSSGVGKMSFWYNYSVRALDFYEFKMAFGPVVRITSETPLTVVDWWLNWVRPLRQLISLATGAPREMRYLLAINDADSERAVRDQVFGWDITHLPINSTRTSIAAVKSSINLATDGLSLLDLLAKWQELTAAQHPLFETYGAMTVAKDQHPRSRFLLLLQALEGSYGFENRATHEKNKGNYAAKRQGFFERAAEVLSAVDLKFMDKNLRREPQEGVDSALAALLKRLPDSVATELDKTDLVAKVQSEHQGRGKLPLQVVLTRARNTLSHGSGTFEVTALSEVADILERVVRSEAVRLLGASATAQERTLNSRDR